MPVLSISSTIPIRSNMSRLRAWIAIARDWSVGCDQLVDHPHADAATGEFAAGDQSDRSGSDDEYIEVRVVAHGLLLIFTVLLKLVSRYVEISLNARGNSRYDETYAEETDNARAEG